MSVCLFPGKQEACTLLKIVKADPTCPLIEPSVEEAIIVEPDTALDQQIPNQDNELQSASEINRRSISPISSISVPLIKILEIEESST